MATCAWILNAIKILLMWNAKNHVAKPYHRVIIFVHQLVVNVVIKGVVAMSQKNNLHVRHVLYSWKRNWNVEFTPQL